MKKQLLRLLLLPAIMYTILGAGFLSTTGLAHAATSQASATPFQTHAAQPAYVAGENCPYGNAEVDNQHQQYWCFSSSSNGEYYNIWILNTGLHTVTWDWYDCNGASHHSSKPPRTIVTAANSPGGFAGSTIMCAVFDVTLS